ncbi:hypothetical protein BDW62DRAFT_213330 [Aspergillus aurantiobrunneus]
MTSRRLSLCVASACALLFVVYALSPSRPLPPATPVAWDPPVSGPAAAGNSTLGFEAILALSPFPSWRTRGLHAAANLTGLHIQTPPQPPILPKAVEGFRSLSNEKESRPNYGSAAAWIAHLDLIKHVIQSDLESALILEDDVDWDLAIREQMVGVAAAVRELTKAPASDATPYGHAWDVLWVGLCVEAWDSSVESALVHDPTVVPSHLYVGHGKPAVDRLPKDQRVVFHSTMPYCTFAYAVSREGARNLLRQLGAGRDMAFDVALMNHCKRRSLNCVSVIPELFRHYTPSPNMRGASLVNLEDKDGDIMDVEVEMGLTENILQSARCHSLWGRSCLATPKPDTESEPEPGA